VTPGFIAACYVPLTTALQDAAEPSYTGMIAPRKCTACVLPSGKNLAGDNSH